MKKFLISYKAWAALLVANILLLGLMLTPARADAPEYSLYAGIHDLSIDDCDGCEYDDRMIKATLHINSVLELSVAQSTLDLGDREQENWILGANVGHAIGTDRFWFYGKAAYHNASHQDGLSYHGGDSGFAYGAGARWYLLDRQSGLYLEVEAFQTDLFDRTHQSITTGIGYRF